MKLLNFYFLRDCLASVLLAYFILYLNMLLIVILIIGICHYSLIGICHFLLTKEWYKKISDNECNFQGAFSKKVLWSYLHCIFIIVAVCIFHSSFSNRCPVRRSTSRQDNVLLARLATLTTTILLQTRSRRSQTGSYTRQTGSWPWINSIFMFYIGQHHFCLCLFIYTIIMTELNYFFSFRNEFLFYLSDDWYQTKRTICHL